nr:MAG TPA: Large polyvalent protein associated domain 29 [Caudoviricetes sp.]
MAIYQATKNIYFSELDKAVIVDDLIDLDEAYAKEVNKKLKDTFPGVKEVLVLVDKNDTLEPTEEVIEEVAADEE